MEAFLMIGGLYIILSFLLSPKDALTLVAGTHRLSKEQKKQYDISGILRVQKLALRLTGLFIVISGCTLMYFGYEAIANHFFFIGASVPLILSSLYCRLKYSRQPVKWFVVILIMCTITVIYLSLFFNI